VSKPSNKRLLIMALVRAVKWEQSLTDCWQCGTPERKASEDLCQQFRDMLRDRGYVEAEPTGPSVTIQELLARKP
jgi:hypothetical protein